MSNELMVKYETNGQEITLSQSDVKNFLVSGDANRVTEKEFKLFLELCKFQKLNPFLRDAYLVKFGDKDANIIVGKDFFIKRAYANEKFKKYTAGIIVLKQNGDLENRAGSFYAQQVEALVGAWCKVEFTDGTDFYHTVAFDEYNTGKSTWASKPATMIRKVALVQALRETFPEDYQGLYDSSEVGVNEEVLPSREVGLINNNQRKNLFELAENNKEIVKAIMVKYGYETTSDIKEEDYQNICDDIEKLVSLNKEEPEVIDEDEVEVIEEVEEEEDFLKGTPFEG